MNWVEEIVFQHAELESPENFWRWSAIAALSAVVKDSIWMNQQIFNLYPNIYVMLHAESGIKKGPPVSMARRLVDEVKNTKIIGGRSSIQGILKELGTSNTVPGGKIINQKSVAFICSSELSSSIVDDPVATKILTDLFDRQYNFGEWRSLLKMESFQLRDPTITMLTATNEAMSEDFFTKSAINGGYFARTFIIYEKDSGKVNSLIYPLSNEIDLKKSAEYLKVIANMKGPFLPLASLIESNEFPNKKEKGERTIYFTEAGLIYDDWYENFREFTKLQETKDETGTLNRFGDSVLKVAMLLSIARAPELIIRPDAMREAIVECEKLLSNVRKATIGKHGTSAVATLKTMIILELLNREIHEISHTILVRKMWSHYSNLTEFNEVMAAFDQAGMIKMRALGNQILYYMPDEQVQELKHFTTMKKRVQS